LRPTATNKCDSFSSVIDPVRSNSMSRLAGLAATQSREACIQFGYSFREVDRGIFVILSLMLDGSR
jgi:hypothetical protein